MGRNCLKFDEAAAQQFKERKDAIFRVDVLGVYEGFVRGE